jgi:hypothetical protein
MQGNQKLHKFSQTYYRKSLTIYPIFLMIFDYKNILARSRTICCFGLFQTINSPMYVWHHSSLYTITARKNHLMPFENRLLSFWSRMPLSTMASATNRSSGVPWNLHSHWQKDLVRRQWNPMRFIAGKYYDKKKKYSGHSSLYTIDI